MGKATIPNRGLGKWNSCETDWGVDDGELEVCITPSSIMVTDHVTGNATRQVTINVGQDGIEALVGMLGPSTGYAAVQYEQGWVDGHAAGVERAVALFEGWVKHNEGRRVGKTNVGAMRKALNRLVEQ